MIHVALSTELFDKVVHEAIAMPDAGDLSLIVKPKGTRYGNPIVCITCTCEVEDKLRRFQTVVTFKELEAAVDSLRSMIEANKRRN